MNTSKLTYTQYTDSELVEAYKKTSNTNLVGALIDRYTLLVLGVCMKYLKEEAIAKDVTMQVFENLFSDLKKHTITNFQSWLYIVTKNNCLLYLRKDKKERENQEYYKQHQLLVMEKDVDLHLDGNTKEQLLIKLEACINKLPPEQKAAVDLFFLQNKCYREVAEITGYNLNAVKSYIQNGKRNLKQCITANNEG